MTAPVVHRIARKFAAGILLDGPATAKDLAHLISMLAPAARATGPEARHAFLVGDPEGAPLLGFRSNLGRLLQDVGAPRAAALATLQGRLRQTRVAFITKVPRDKRLWNQAFERMVADRHGRLGPLDEVTCHVHRSLAYWAHMEVDATGCVAVDLTAMRGFGCRYSAVVYLRALAWMAWGRSTLVLKGTWKYERRPDGSATLRIPFEDVADALGVVGFDQASKISEKILEPAEADLRRAGIVVTHDWKAVPGKVRQHSHLTMEFRWATEDERQEAPARRRGRPVQAREAA